MDLNSTMGLFKRRNRVSQESNGGQQEDIADEEVRRVLRAKEGPSASTRSLGSNMGSSALPVLLEEGKCDAEPHYGSHDIVPVGSNYVAAAAAVSETSLAVGSQRGTSIESVKMGSSGAVYRSDELRLSHQVNRQRRSSLDDGTVSAVSADSFGDRVVDIDHESNINSGINSKTFNVANALVRSAKGNESRAGADANKSDLVTVEGVPGLKPEYPAIAIQINAEDEHTSTDKSLHVPGTMSRSGSFRRDASGASINLESSPKLTPLGELAPTSSPKTNQLVIPPIPSSRNAGSASSTRSKLKRQGNLTQLRDPSDMFDIITYPPTMHQRSVYASQANSTEEDKLNMELNQVPVHVACYRYGLPLHQALFLKCFHRVICLNRVLVTRLYRNPKILDADVEACINVQNVNESEYIRILPSALDWEDGQTLVQETVDALQQNQTYFYTFLHIKESMARIYIMISPVVGDALTCDILAGQCLKLYTESLALAFHVPAYTTIPVSVVESLSDAKISQCVAWFPTVLPRPSMDFVYFAEDEDTAPIAQRETALTFFKSQMFESRQEYVDLTRRTHLERETERVESDRRSKGTQITAMISQIASMEIELSKVETTRAKLNPTGGPSTFFHDDDGQLIEIPQEVRELLLKTVLEECQSISELLVKQGALADTVKRLQHLSMEQFAELKEADLMREGIVGREKRKTMALIEYVKNRIREGLQEHTKLKYDLEKKALRYRRDIAAQRTLLKTRSMELDRLAHVLLQYRNLIHPPLVFALTPFACLDTRLGDGKTPYPSLADLSNPIPIVLQYTPKTSLLRALERYSRENIKRSAITSAPTSKEVAAVHEEEEDESSGIALIMMSLYAILVKHITGLDSFALGLVTSARHSRGVQGIAVGPLSATVPVRIDLKDLHMPLHLFVAQMAKTTILAQERAMHVSDIAFYSDLEADVNAKQEARELEEGFVAGVNISKSLGGGAKSSRPLVTFEYISSTQVRFFQAQGVPLDVLLERYSTDRDMVDDEHGEGWNTEKSQPTTPIKPDPVSNLISKEYSYLSSYEVPDLSLRIVEDPDVKEGYGRFKLRLAARRDVPPRVLERWADKFRFLLENIETAHRGISIATVISRFYHAIWSGQRNGFPIDDQGGLTSLTELRQSLASLV
jgi:hypothetical protein